jgi:hypothetical protein
MLLRKGRRARVNFASMVLKFVMGEFSETLSTFNIVRKCALSLNYLIKRELPGALLAFIGITFYRTQRGLGYV